MGLLLGQKPHIRIFPKKSLKSILILSLYAKNHKSSDGQLSLPLETIHFEPMLGSLGPKTFLKCYSQNNCSNIF